MREYLKLMRIHHYIKNFLIFFPLVFSGMVFNVELLKVNIIGFFSFSFIASFIYVINDIMDVEQDRLHPIKCKRPIASGKIDKKNAIIFALILFAISALCNGFVSSEGFFQKWILWSIYILINFGYSFGLKKVPIIDIIILAMGFLIRIWYGGVISNIHVSFFMYSTVLSISIYMSLGKRRNELKNQGECVRKVLRYYNYKVINIFMVVFFFWAICFYSLWCINAVTIRNYSAFLYFTIPLFFLIIYRYSKNIEGKVDGDPVNVILKDKVTLFLGFVFMIFIYSIII